MKTILFLGLFLFIFVERVYSQIIIKNTACIQIYNSFLNSIDIFIKANQSAYDRINAGIGTISRFKDLYNDCTNFTREFKENIEEKLVKFKHFGHLVKVIHGYVKENKAISTKAFVIITKRIKDGNISAIHEWIHKLLDLEIMLPKEPKNNTFIFDISKSDFKLLIFNFALYSGFLPITASSLCIANFEETIKNFVDLIFKIWFLENPISSLFKFTENLNNLFNSYPYEAQNLLYFPYENYKGFNNVLTNIRERPGILTSNFYNIQKAVSEKKYDQIGAFTGLFLKNLLFTELIDTGSASQKKQHTEL